MKLILKMKKNNVNRCNKFYNENKIILLLKSFYKSTSTKHSTSPQMNWIHDLASLTNNLKLKKKNVYTLFFSLFK